MCMFSVSRIPVLVLICAIFLIHGQVIKDVDFFSTPLYYDPSTKVPYRLTSVENFLKKDQYSTKNSGLIGIKPTKIRKIGFRSNGCTCHQLACGCCLGINLNQFNFNREGCMNFTYDPQEFSVTMDMFMNDNNIFSNSFSAKNPPPLCIPIVIPYVPIQIDACARLFNIYTPGQNLHMCFDFETRIQQATLLVLHFDCMRMGADGVALVKPGDNGGLPTTAEPEQVDSDIYDEVTEVKTVTDENLYFFCDSSRIGQ